MNSNKIIEVIEKLIKKVIGGKSILPSYNNKMEFSKLSSSFLLGQIIL
jgi:hypothetical protein